MTRLPAPAGSAVDPTGTVEFDFDGKRYRGFPGDTIASALYAAGVRVFSRSFKYHRPRGLLCVDGRCPNCLCNVDGTPNVRICTIPLEPAMRVRSQNVWPSLKRDALRLTDHVSALLPVGFYYKTFIRPHRLWPVYERVLRRVAGLGALDPRSQSKTRYIHESRHTDVAVVGGGPAGLAAASEAARLGAHVTLIDDQPELGGHVRYAGSDSERSATGHSAAELADAPNVEVLLSASAFGAYEGKLLAISQGTRLIELRYRTLVVATGQAERPLVFLNNDLPGIMLGAGVQRLMHLYGVAPGQRAVVASNGGAGFRVAENLVAAGIHVAVVADALPESRWGAWSESAVRLRTAGVQVLAGLTPSAAHGNGCVERIILSHLDDLGIPVAGAYLEVPCDLVVLATGRDSSASLLAQAGARLVYDAHRDRFLPDNEGLPPGVYAAGEIRGVESGGANLTSDGRVAGARAALKATANESAAAAVADAERGLAAPVPPSADVRPLVSTAGAEPGKAFVCLCEDVTEKDVVFAMQEGFDHVETLKRYTTFSMGPCQGRMCHASAVALVARENGLADRSGSALTTARPPAQPVELGLLAGILHEPARRSAMHQAQLELRPEIMDLGEWKRPRTYLASADDEVRAVRERVGIIDVSSLGKLDVRGRDAGGLLDFVYTNRVSDLKPGRVRYGVICDDAGIILDDGTIARLGDDRFFISTTTSGVGAVQEWMDWWIAAGPERCVHVTTMTSAFAAINLAGPRSREVLQKLTSLDISSNGAPYLATLQGEVAQAPTLLLRIGFVGELGYEMHFPAEYGEHMWRALLAAGAEFGIQPFGVEAQRIMRLEKGHLIVTQDTDGLTNPHEAGMSWIVKLDKPDFVGKPSLRRLKAGSNQRNRLVGFEMHDSRLVPAEGNAVVLHGQSVGRVTSSRWSPTLGKSIGLAWVPLDQAADSPIQIRVDGVIAQARVVKTPFYDADGARMKV